MLTSDPSDPESWKPGRVDRQQRPDAEKSHDEPQGSTSKRQQHAFGQQLANDAAAAGANR